MQLEFFFKQEEVIPLLFLSKKDAVCTSFTDVGIREFASASSGHLYDDA
jgi:hypothetical protein